MLAWSLRRGSQPSAPFSRQGVAQAQAACSPWACRRARSWRSGRTRRSRTPRRGRRSSRRACSSRRCPRPRSVWSAHCGGWRSAGGRPGPRPHAAAGDEPRPAHHHRMAERWGVRHSEAGVDLLRTRVIAHGDLARAHWPPELKLAPSAPPQPSLLRLLRRSGPGGPASCERDQPPPMCGCCKRARRSVMRRYFRRLRM